MADEDSPVEQRLDAASAYFIALGGKMHRMAEQVRKLARDRDEALAELLDAELERDRLRDERDDLADDIEAMRLGIRTPEEVIERA